MCEEKQTEFQRIGFLRLGAGILFAAVLVWLGFPVRGGVSAVSAQAEATPTPDRLAEPPLSEDSTQYEEGAWLFWYHCMTCHGDFGQGLTEEFIELWPEEEQNCWGRGCHGGRMDDEGFPIPRTVPAIIDEDGASLKFARPDTLYSFLKATHPPQYPGTLTEDEYWAITAYVLVESDLLQPSNQLGLTVDEQTVPGAGGIPFKKINWPLSEPLKFENIKTLLIE